MCWTAEGLGLLGDNAAALGNPKADEEVSATVKATLEGIGKWEALVSAKGVAECAAGAMDFFH